MAATARPRTRRLVAVLSRRLRATSITTRLVLLALLLVGTTAVTVGTLSYRRARAALAATAETRLELLARDVAQALHRELTDYAADITTWARLETMVALTFEDVDKQLAELMHQTLQADADYVGIVGLHVDGRAIASAGAPPEVVPAAAPPEGTRLAVVEDAARGGPVLRLDTPVMNPRRPDERIGTLASYLDPGRLLRRVARGRIEGAATTVTVRAAALPLATVGAPARPRDAARDPDRGVFAEQLRVPPLRGVTAPEILVMASQPTAVALASVRALRTTLVRIGLAVVALSGLLGAVVAWRLSVPIRRLTAAVEQVSARGRPEPLMHLPRAGGEVGVLTDAFDSMMERLGAAQREVVAQSRLALLGEIAASIAHDVRTPLSVLKTSAQLLGSAELSDAEEHDLAEMITSEVDRLSGVIDRLVDLARPQSVHRTVEPVHLLVERAVAVLRPWARARGVTIETSGPTALCALVDADQVQQALLNVAHNAARASSTPGTVTIRWHEDGRSAVIEIADTGPGFSPDGLAHAFSPFFTTQPDGTGLGLAITKRLVEGHGGTVGARNLPAGGACVWLTLPTDVTA